jgi:hypothetical protein
LIKNELEEMRPCKEVWVEEDKVEGVGHRWTVGFDFVEGMKARGHIKLENEEWSDRV